MKRAERSVSSIPRSTGVNGSGFTGAPARAAMCGGGRVGLLAGDAALLDRERGDVAGGVDVGDALHARVGVGGRKPVRVGRQAGDRRALRGAAA